MIDMGCSHTRQTRYADESDISSSYRLVRIPTVPVAFKQPAEVMC
jgi:hypothetical protein